MGIAPMDINGILPVPHHWHINVLIRPINGHRAHPAQMNVPTNGPHVPNVLTDQWDILTSRTSDCADQWTACPAQMNVPTNRQHVPPNACAD